MLDLSFNHISQVQGLESLLSLSKLFLIQNKLTKMEGFSSLTQLTMLELGSNRIKVRASVLRVGVCVRGVYVPPTYGCMHMVCTSHPPMGTCPTHLWVHVPPTYGCMYLVCMSHPPITTVARAFQEIDGLDSLVNLESLFLGKNRISKLKVRAEANSSSNHPCCMSVVPVSTVISPPH